MKTLGFVPKTFFRGISTSRFSAALCWPKPDYGPLEVQRSELMNGVRVAAVKPMGAHMTAATIMFQAGSRYEIDDELGATHFLRVMAAASGCGFTAYAKSRHLQQMGANLTCKSDRQTISFTLRCPPTCYPDLKYYLLDAAMRCCFHDWEIDERRHVVQDDLVRITEEQRVLDLLQKAMWAGPLSNSIFCLEERINYINQDILRGFAGCHFRTDGCTIASIGVPFEETLKLAEKIEPRRERPAPRCEMLSCPRGGFELYDLGPCSDTWIAVGVPGSGTMDHKNMFKHAIIAAACGVGNIAMGQHVLDSTPQPPLGMMVGTDPHTEFKAFNISYNNNGVFGILTKAHASLATQVAQCAAEFLSNVGELNFKQIEIGKKRLKVSVTLSDDNCASLTEGMCLQLANGVTMDNCGSTLAMIDAIPADEISCTARGLSALCPCMAVAVVGDIGNVPHDRYLVCGI